MKEKPILPLVLSISIPSMLSMFINSLYNIVDSYFVAKISEDAMTAVFVVFPLQNISLAVAVGFSVGLNALVSFQLGSGDEKKASATGSLSIFLCFLHGIAVSIFCILILPGFLAIYRQNASITAMSTEYAWIVLAFSAIKQLYIGFEKIYQAVGKMYVMMTAMIFGCVANIILDPLMIFGIGPFPEMGVAGAAWATVIGQTLELLFYCAVYAARPLSVKLSPSNIKFDREIIKRLYSVGIPASLNSMLSSLLISSLNGILSAFSSVYIAILGVYYKLQSFVYMPVYGLMQGIRPLVGYNFGAREYERVRGIYRTAVGISALFMILGTVLCQFFPMQLMSLFAETPETVRDGAEALRIISLGFAASSLSISACASLEGLGMGLQSLCIALLRYTVLIVPLASLLSSSFGPGGVWHAFWITELAAGLLSLVIFRRGFGRSIKKYG